MTAAPDTAVARVLAAVVDAWASEDSPAYLRGLARAYQHRHADGPCPDERRRRRRQLRAASTPSAAAAAWSPTPAAAPLAALRRLGFGGGLRRREARVLDALCACADSLTWFHNQSPQWVNANANSKTDTSCVVVGDAPDSPLPWGNVISHAGGPVHASAGFMWIGPHNIYPPHAHSAEEAYYIVAGRCRMGKNHEPEREYVGGDCAHHLPHDVHWLRTQESPVLVCWAHSGKTRQQLHGAYYFVVEGHTPSPRAKL